MKTEDLIKQAFRAPEGTVTRYSGYSAENRAGPDSDRGTGRTTRQMQQAPNGAIFVWCTRDLDYPQSIARQIKRQDLRLESPGFFDRPGHHWKGLSVAVVVDHAAYRFLTPAQREGYFECMARVEAKAPSLATVAGDSH